MTQEKKDQAAPEHIWAVHYETHGAIMNGEWADTVRHLGGIEYIRADLAAPSAQDDWVEIEQGYQPRLSDGYTAVKASKPGFWFVQGAGPASAQTAPSAPQVHDLESGETRTLAVTAVWKPCVHGGGWWIAKDADGRDVILSSDTLHDAPSAPAEVEGLVVLRKAADAATGDPARYPRRGIIDRYQSAVVAAYENGDLVASTAPTALQAENERLTHDLKTATMLVDLKEERAENAEASAEKTATDNERLVEALMLISMVDGNDTSTKIAREAIAKLKGEV